MIDYSEICDSVVNAAKLAGGFIREQRQIFKSDSIEYKGTNDLVSYVDKGAEKILVDQLQPLIADAGFITEEGTLTVNEKEFVWVIDPLDGTTNFIHGLPCFCVSIGLLRNGVAVLGVVYEINLDECFYGWENGGAWMNGNRISVSNTKNLSESLLATGFPYSNYDRMKPYMEVFNHCMYHTHGLRRLGSAAADLAYVACGRLDGFFEYGLSPWDVAGGVLLVREAGGKVTDFKRKNDFIFGREIVAGNSFIMEEFLDVVEEKFSKS
jgi:myo-inositol-1(or 4)-monophosphatase